MDLLTLATSVGHTCVYVCVHVHVHVHVFVHVHLHILVCVHVRVPIYVFAYAFVYVYVVNGELPALISIHSTDLITGSNFWVCGPSLHVLS